jgi:hypothetical protein
VLLVASDHEEHDARVVEIAKDIARELGCHLEDVSRRDH